MRKTRLALAQVKSEFGDTQSNLKKAQEIIVQASKEKTNIICFPELFYGGYYLKRADMHKVAEDQHGEFVTQMRDLAKKHNIYIISGYAESTEVIGQVYNSAIFIDNLGNIIGNTRKIYLWGKEKLQFKSGNTYPVYDTPLGKIGILICYDNEYPEPARIMALKGAELIFVPAVWSESAENRWDIQLSANAMFNLMFTAGANTIGEGICGKSQIFGPNGLLIKKASKDKEEILICDIDLDNIIEVRNKIPYFTDFNDETLPPKVRDKF